MALELAQAGAPRVNSEYRRLTAALLYCPGREMLDIKDPNAAQHLAGIDPLKIRREYRKLAAVLKEHGVAVHMIRTGHLTGGKPPDKYNLMYVRDLFVNTMEGAVIARMASAVRAGEEKFAAAALTGLGVPILGSIAGKGLLEGADVLWLDERTVICGTGNRTNTEGFRQLRGSLAPQGVRAVSVKLPGGVQHLLGLLQIVDRKLALLRVQKATGSIRAVLKKNRFTIIPVPETDEVTRRQGMNIVTIAPRKIIMAAGCPGLKALYLKAGLSVAAEVEISQLVNGAGGLACAALTSRATKPESRHRLQLIETTRRFPWRRERAKASMTALAAA
ncbi:MAG: arginine deiminase family protein [Elusimicrobiota bacterium]